MLAIKNIKNIQALAVLQEFAYFKSFQ
jgi:hypothetical protein